MICTSIAEPTVEKCLEALRELDFAEIRLDRISAEPNEMERIFSLPKQLIATCRPGARDDTGRLSLLMAAIETGASFVDIEIDSDGKFKEDIIRKARASDCRVILSYHNYVKTPTGFELKDFVQSCFLSGGDIAKIACRVHSHQDTLRLLGLLEDKRPLIVAGLGEKGKICRIAAPLLGSLFAYASREKGKETAPGQIDAKTLAMLLQRIKNV